MWEYLKDSYTIYFRYHVVEWLHFHLIGRRQERLEMEALEKLEAEQ